MKKLIILLAIIGAAVLAIYPPFKSTAQPDTSLYTMKATDHLIEVVEQKNDEKIDRLNQNISVIDSLNEIEIQPKKVVRAKSKKPAVEQQVKKKTAWQKLTSIFRRH